MRLLTWNCQQGFERKLHALLAETPDIAVVQECSRGSLGALKHPYRGQWLTGPENKGLAVIIREPYEVSAVEVSPRITYFARVAIVNPCSFHVIACWNTRQVSFSYPEQLHMLLDEHGDWFETSPIFLAGDLNSQPGAAFDTGKRRHRHFEERLEALGLVNAYAAARGLFTADWADATYRHLRNDERRFHIDYIYIPKQALPSSSDVTIGSQQVWSRMSDHSPVMVNIRLPSSSLSPFAPDCGQSSW